MADWLQFGAMGLLAAVLLAIGVGLREWLRQDQARRQATDEMEAKRRANLDGFLRALVEADRAERRDSMAQWRQMVEADIEVKRKLAAALDGLCVNIREHEQATETRHKSLLAALE